MQCLTTKHAEEPKTVTNREDEENARENASYMHHTSLTSNILATVMGVPIPSVSPMDTS
jgi:hypothetical protein